MASMRGMWCQCLLAQLPVLINCRLWKQFVAFAAQVRYISSAEIPQNRIHSSGYPNVGGSMDHGQVCILNPVALCAHHCVSQV
jgi:hypothetical protein